MSGSMMVRLQCGMNKTGLPIMSNTERKCPGEWVVMLLDRCKDCWVEELRPAPGGSEKLLSSLKYQWKILQVIFFDLESTVWFSSLKNSERVLFC